MEKNKNKKEQIQSALEKTNFQKLTKKDFFNLVNQFNELSPGDTAKIINQFPEFVRLISSMAIEYKKILEDVEKSDDNSLENVYSILVKEIDQDAESRQEYFVLASNVLASLTQELDNPSISKEERSEIRGNIMDLLRLAYEKDSEIRNFEMENVHIAEAKDTEKRELNRTIIEWVCIFAALGLGILGLGGNSSHRKK